MVHRAVLALMPVFLFASAAAGQDRHILELQNGGALVGVASPEKPQAADSVTVTLAEGGTIVLDRSAVRSIRPEEPEEVEYRRRAPITPMTIDAQWELAEWCGKIGLKREREFHLRQILELDTNHVPARRALGYYQHRGQWTTPEEYREREGFVKRDGRWRLHHEAMLMDAREEREQQYHEWVRRLERWRTQMLRGKPHEARAAREQFVAIRDAAAIDPLTELVLAERWRPLKLFYVRILATIEHPRAANQLVYISLVDPDEEMFYGCLDQIVSRQLPNTVKIYIEALRNVDNVRVNRAAAALKRLDDPSAIAPLIEALVTSHPVLLPSSGPPGMMTTGFVRSSDGQSGGTAFSNESPGPVVTTVTVPNQEVLSALVSLTGESFGFSQSTWRQWHASQRQLQTSVTPVLRGAP